MAYSREIIKKVLQYVRFRVPQTEEKNSYYTEIGNTLVRISNHCTRLRVWDEILEKNPKWKGKPIISIVFEDDEDTFDEVDCLVLKRFRMKPIKVTEYVYRLQGDPQFITPQDERLIISGIEQVQGGKYTDLTNKCSEPILRVSQNPPSVPPNNQELNTEQYMNKKLIRLTENDLHRIVKRSVNKVLRESYNDDDVYMSNYRDAMSDREDTYTIDDLFSELKEEGYDFLENSHPNAWLPGNWMQVMQVAEKLGYPEDIKELIIHEIERNISFEQKNLDYVKNYKWRI